VVLSSIDVLLLDVEAHELLEVVDRIARGDPEDAVAEVLDLGTLDVVLVGDLTDDLLEDVFQRNDALEIAELVDDQSEVLAAVAKCLQLVEQLG